MKESPITMHPAEIMGWEAEDLVSSVLGENPEPANDEEVRAMLNQLRISLPRQIQRAELVSHAAQLKSPLGEGLEPGEFSYFLAEVPLNILVPENHVMVRLRLQLDLGGAESGALAYDLFPPDQWEVGEKSLGQVDVDVSKLLTFVSPAPIAECLGFKLGFPIKWKTLTVNVSTSDRMSNPAEWYVKDESIRHGFVAYLIVRAPKGELVEVQATLACELRKAGPLGRMKKKQFRSDRRAYSLQGD
jgi:hypothetical protein